MTCKAISARLDRFVDGELELHERAQVSRHLEMCEDCRAEAHALGELRSIMEQLKVVEPEAGFEERLVATVFSNVERKERRERNVWIAAAAASTCLMMLGIMAAVSMRETRFKEAELAEGRFEMSRDQAYVSSSDPLSGGSALMPVEYQGR